MGFHTDSVIQDEEMHVFLHQKLYICLIKDHKIIPFILII